MQDEGRAGRVAPVWKAGGPLGGRPHPPSPTGGSGGKHLPPPGPVSTGPASGSALSCRCFSLWVRTGCEGFWCPRPEGWVTQGGPPELEGAPGGRGLLQCTGKSVDPGLGPRSPPASAVQPPPLVPPQSSTSAKVDQQKALWKPSLNRVTSFSEGPWGEMQAGPENPLVLPGHRMSFILMGTGDRDILSTAPTRGSPKVPGSLRYNPVRLLGGMVGSLADPVLEAPYLGTLLARRLDHLPDLFWIKQIKLLLVSCLLGPRGSSDP